MNQINITYLLFTVRMFLFSKYHPHCTPSICIHVRFAGDGRAWVIQGAVDDVASAVPWQAGWNDPGNTDLF